MWFMKPNVEKLLEKENIGGLLKALEYKDEKVRRDAAAALGKLKDIFAVTPLINALKDETWGVRKNAAEALGNIGSMKAVRPLLELLRDEDSDVRNTALEALSKTGLPDDPEIRIQFAIAREDWKMAVNIGEPAVAPLISLLKEGTKEVRKGSATALGEIRDDRAIDPLVELLKSDSDSQVRKAAAIAISGFDREFDENIRAICAVEKEDWSGAISFGKASISPLSVAAKSSNKSVKKAALKTLGEIRDPDSLEVLFDIHKNADDEIKMVIDEALGKIKDSRAVDLLISDLDCRSKEIRYSAANALGIIKDRRAVDPLIRILNDEYEWVRQASAKALGQIGDKKAIDSFINLLDSKERQLNYTAIEALGNIGDSSVVEPLITALAHDDAFVRKAAAEALGRIGDKKALSPLIEILSDNDESPRIAAADALGEIGEREAAEPLKKLLKDEDWTVRRSAIRALGKIGDPGSVPLLVDFLDDENESVRKTATEAFENIGIPEDSHHKAVYAVAKRNWALALEMGKESLPHLEKALKDSDPEVRLSAANTIEKIQIPDDPQIRAFIFAVKKEWNKTAEVGEAAIDSLLWSLKNQSRDDHEEIIDAMVKIGCPAVDALIGFLREKDDQLKQLAISALGKIGEKKAVKPLISCLRDNNLQIRVSAAGSLCNMGEEVVEPLLDALSESRPEVREASAGALGQMGDKRAVEPLIKLLSDKNFTVRKAATWALGRIDDDRTTGPLLSVVSDENPSVREAAAWALGKKGNTEAVEPMISLLRDDNVEVRKAAAGSLGNIGSSRAVNSLKALLEDDDEQIQKAAIVALGDIRSARAVESLIKLLEVQNSPHIMEVLKALGKISSFRAVEPIMKLAGSNDRQVKLEALRALGAIGDFGAIKILIAAGRDEDPEIRATANEALKKIDKPLDATIQVTEAINKENWEEVLSYGKTAAAPLKNALLKGKVNIRDAAVTLVSVEGDDSLIAQAFLCHFGNKEEKEMAKSILLEFNKESVQPLVDVLKSTYAAVEVVKVLRELNDRNSVSALQEELQTYSKGTIPRDKEMAEAIREALESIGEVRTFDALKLVLKEGATEEQKKSAADSLIKLNLTESLLGYIYLLRYGNVHERKDALNRILKEKPHVVEKLMHEVLEENRNFLIVYNRKTGDVLDVFLTDSYNTDGTSLVVHQKKNQVIELKPDKGFIEIKPRGMDFVFNFKPICYMLMKADYSEYIVVKNSFLKLVDDV